MPQKNNPLSRLLIAAAFSLAAFWPAAASAQEYEKEAQKPGAEKAAQVEAARTAEEAKKIEAEGEDITYEQVLADPDNIELNYRYARSQVRKGDLKGAAATLERILLVNPNLPKVRLFYAIVLYRLDNIVEAERELNALKGAGVPENIRSEAEQYLRQVEKRKKLTHLSGRLSVGWEYDVNRNAAPASNQRLFGDVPFTLTGNSQRRSDTSMLFMGNVEARRDLGTQAGHEAFGSFTYYQAEQTNQKTLNLKAYSFAAGGVYKSPWVDVTPTALFDHVQLAQTTFLRNHGGSVRLDKRLSRRLGVYFEFKDVFQDFVKTPIVPVAPERTGVQVDYTLGGDYLLNPVMKVGLGAGHTAKHAFKEYNAFDRNSVFVNHSWLLGKGMFLLSSLTVNDDKYKQPDFAISGKFREDTTYRADVTYGTPLGLIHRSLKDLVWTVTYEYYHAKSSIRNYAYSNNKVATLLTYRWDIAL